MCGIAGVLYADRMRRPDHGVLTRMAGCLAHRGPDAEGLWADAGIGLVHRRLSIIDLSTAADHPVGNEDGSVQVVFNGEIYNYRDLRVDLAARGHVLRTEGDTETLVHLYEDEQDRLVSRLRGMFAFGLWDARRRTLLLARDRVGIKPLYVYRDDEKVIFGSELKAILAHGDVDASLDPHALDDYLAYGFISGPRSIFRHVRKLLPAHTLAISVDAWHAEPRRYWALQYEPDHAPSAQEWVERVHDKVAETVRCHLVADVRVGAFLSGGVDSTIVVGEAAAQSAQRLRTFSIGFDEEAFSELPYAREAALRFGTEHHEEIARPDAVALIDQLAVHYDEPFADSSALPTFIVSRLASRSVKVVLSGDGGDEAFGGYPRYAHDAREARLRSHLPGWFTGGVLSPLAAAWPRADWLPRPLRAKTTLTNLALDTGAAYANSLAICRGPLRRHLMHPDLRSRLGAHLTGQRIAHTVNSTAADPAAGMMAADLEVRVPDDYLTKVDRSSMAFGLEVRPPFLDHELLELSARVPSSVKMRAGVGKWVLRQAFTGMLPPSASRPKRGFEIPVDRWLRGPLRGMFEDVVLATGGPLDGLVHRETAESMYRHHLAGRRREGSTLWSLLILARWASRYRGAGADTAVAPPLRVVGSRSGA